MTTFIITAAASIIAFVVAVVVVSFKIGNWIAKNVKTKGLTSRRGVL